MILPLRVEGWGGGEWNGTDQKKEKKKKVSFPDIEFE